jgi:hypothetical protein
MVRALKEHRNRMADLFRLAAVGYHFASWAGSTIVEALEAVMVTAFVLVT